MLKIFFPSIPNQDSDTGISFEEGSTYLMLDGSRGMSGVLVPSNDNTLAIGTSILPFSSGVFTICACVGAYQLRPQGNELHVHDTSGNNINGRSANWYTSISGLSLSSTRLHFPNSGQVVWTPSNDVTVNYDVNYSRYAAGILRVGTTSSNSSGAIEALSGVFRTQLVFAAPNGSGWILTVDNSGILSTNGPIIIG